MHAESTGDMDCPRVGQAEVRAAGVCVNAADLWQRSMIEDIGRGRSSAGPKGLLGGLAR